MLPNYTVRESYKAKHVSLKISALGSLEVIIPPGYDQKHIPDILRRKQRWIERVTQRLEARQKLTGVQLSEQLPEQVQLQAIGEVWQITYHATPLPGIRWQEQSNFNLVLYGNVADRANCKSAIQAWLTHKAKVHLIPWLRAVSQQVHLPHDRVSVRWQKTRWGSCSSSKSISLNGKLLFLSAPLVRYVFVHELCHTVHLNHSSQFWALVHHYEPDYQRLDAQLHEARYNVPLWLEES